MCCNYSFSLCFGSLWQQWHVNACIFIYFHEIHLKDCSHQTSPSCNFFPSPTIKSVLVWFYRDGYLAFLVVMHLAATFTGIGNNLLTENVQEEQSICFSVRCWCEYDVVMIAYGRFN